MSITEEQLAELERLEREATGRDWAFAADGDYEDIAEVFGPLVRGDGKSSTAILSQCCPLPDAAFIVASRNALPALIQEVRRLKEENAAPLRHGAAEERAKIVKWLTLHGQLSLAKFIERGEAGE